MSLLCSLTGHDWGETRTETERDERRGEVAVTEREFRVCDRCGERRVVAENTEVRAAGGDAEGGEDGGGESTTFAPSETPHPAERRGDTGAGDPGDDARDAAIIDDDGGATASTEGDGDDGNDVRDRVRESTGAEVSRAGDADDSEGGADYVCPDCGYETSEGSAREGDICPDCGAYIEEA